MAVEDTIQLENMLISANEFEKFKLLDAAEHIRSAFSTRAFGQMRSCSASGRPGRFYCES